MTIAKRYQINWARIGQDMTLKRHTETFNVSTGQTSTVTTQDAFKGVMTRFSKDSIDETNILFGDRKITCAQLDMSIAPAINDIIVVGSDNYIVKGVVEVHVRGALVAYELQVRGA